MSQNLTLVRILHSFLQIIGNRHSNSLPLIVAPDPFFYDPALRRFVLAAAMSLTVFFSATGQTGPGGVGNATNNVLWLSADQGVFSDAGVTAASNGDNVRQWSDRSGNGRHAAQATSANRPNYQTGQLNGLPVVRFTAANTDRLISSGLSTSNRASVWVVARYTSLPSPNPGLVQGYPFGADGIRRLISRLASGSAAGHLSACGDAGSSPMVLPGTFQW